MIMRQQADDGGRGVIDLLRAELAEAVLNDLRTVLKECPAAGVNCTGAVVVDALSWPRFEIGGVVTFAHAIISGDADFSRCRFRDEVNFADAVFERRATFGEACFERLARFEGTKFEIGADFQLTTFEGRANFSSSEWRNASPSSALTGARFDRAVFKRDFDFGVQRGTGEASDCSFELVSFQGDAAFGARRFCGVTNFNRAHFGGDALFDGCRWEGWAQLSRTHFASAAIFHHAHFTTGASFREAIFAGRAEFDQAVLANPGVDGPDWGGCRFEGQTTFVDVRHDAWRVEGATFEGDLVLGMSDEEKPITFAGSSWTKPTSLKVVDTWLVLDECVLAAATSISPGRALNAFDPPTAPGRTVRFPWRAGIGGLAKLERCSILDVVTVSDLSFEKTTFTGSTGLDRLRFASPPTWPRPPGPKHWWHRWRSPWRVVRDEIVPSPPDAVHLEGLYRQIRVGLENSKAAPAAADFYARELEARRRAQPHPGERLVLFAYRWIGGYGVRFLLPVLWFSILVAATAAAMNLRARFFQREVGGRLGGYNVDQHYGEALAYVARNSVSLFTAPTDQLTALGTGLLLVERFAAVSLLALSVLAIRSKVVR